MDNLLLNAIRFILEPESSFSVLFLIVFIFCFVYGVWQAKSCIDCWKDFEANAEEKYATERDHYLPSTFIGFMQEELAAKENTLTDLPNIFVTIGILGTFIGLGVAIQGAASLLNDENIDLSKLNAMLGVIAFKFQISVWGTIFSLVFQKLIVGHYHKVKQKIMVQVMRVLYQHEVPARTTLERHLNVVSNTQEYAKKHYEDFSDYVGLTTKFIDDMNQFSTNTVNYHHQMCEHYEKYIGLATKFADSVNHFSENVDIYHQRMTKTINEVSKNLIDEQEWIKENVKAGIEEFVANVTLMKNEFLQGQQEVEEGQRKSHEEITEMQQHILDEIIRSIECLQKVFVREEKNYLNYAQKTFNQMLKENLENIHDTYVRAANKLDTTVEKLSAKLNGVDTQVETMHNEFINEQSKFMDSHRKTFDKIRAVMEEITQTELEHQSNVQACYKNMEQIWQLMDKATKANANEFKVFIDGIKDDLALLCKNVVDGQNNYQKALTDFNNHLREKAKIQVNRMDEIHQSMKEILKENQRVNQSLKDMPSSLMSFKIPQK